MPADRHLPAISLPSADQPDTEAALLTTLERYLRDALHHLEARAYLETHPLTTLLGTEGRPLSGTALRELLLELLERLRPLDGASTEAHEIALRQYQHLVMRYREGKGLEEIAAALHVSLRQASRDHQEALRTLARLLLARIRSSSASALVSSPADLPALAGPDSPARASLPEIFTGILATLQRLLPGVETRCQVSLPDTLPAVAADPLLLREAFFHLLLFALHVAPTSIVQVGGTDTAAGVVVHIRCLSPLAADAPPPSLPLAAGNIEELFSTGAQLIHTQRGQVAWRDADRCLTVTLPPVDLYRILLVDDNPDLARLFRRYLAAEPFRIIQATTAAAALQCVRTLHPDVILLDILMRGQDGWEILASLRQEPAAQGVPIIICSVLPEQTAARLLGVAGFLPKPVTRQSLLAILSQTCHRPRAVPAPLGSPGAPHPR